MANVGDHALGAAFVDLYAKMDRYDRDLANALTKLNAFGSSATKVMDRVRVGAAGWQSAMRFAVPPGLAATQSRLSGIDSRLQRVTANANRAAAALKSLGGAGRTPGGGYGARAVGAGVGQAAAGFGKGMAAILAAAGSASAANLKSLGSGLSQAAAGFGKGLGSAIQSTKAPIGAMGVALTRVAQGTGRSLATVTLAAGRASAANARALGSGLGQASSGFGRGLASAIRATGSPINALGSSLSRIARGFGSAIQSSLRGAGSMLRLPSLGSLGGVGALGGGAGVIGLAGFSAKEAMDQERSMRTLGRVSGVGDDGMKLLRERLDTLASTRAGVGLSDMNKVATMGGRLGVADQAGGGRAGAAALGRFTADVSRLKQALPDMDVEESATSIVKLLNLFKMGPSSILPFASALTRLDNASTATGPELLELTRRLSGVAGVLKGSPQQVMALAAAMKDAGVDSSVGGTAVSQLMMKMATDTRSFARAVKIDVQDLSRTIATDPVEAVRTWIDALSGFDPTKQLEILKSLHMQGRQSGQTILQLAAGFGNLGKYLGYAKEEWRSLDSVNRASNDTSKNAWDQLTRLGNQFQLTGAAIGEHALPAIKSFAGATGEVLADVRGSLARNGGTFEAWGKRVAVAVRGAGTIWRSWPQYVQLASVVAMEKLEQGQAVAGRIFDAMGARFKHAIQSIPQVLGNVLLGGFDYLGTIIGQAAARLGAMFANGILGQVKGIADRLAPLLSRLGMAVDPKMFKPLPVPVIDAAGAAARFDPFRGIAPAPRLDRDNLFKGLPDRGPQKAKIGAEIDAIRARGEVERKVAAGKQEAEDVAGRAADEARDRERVLGPLRPDLEARRRRVAMMAPGRARTRAVDAFRKQGAEAGFAAGDLGVPTRGEALRQQAQEKMAAAQARNRRGRPGAAEFVGPPAPHVPPRPMGDRQRKAVEGARAFDDGIRLRALDTMVRADDALTARERAGRQGGAGPTPAWRARAAEMDAARQARNAKLRADAAVLPADGGRAVALRAEREAAMRKRRDRKQPFRPEVIRKMEEFQQQQPEQGGPGDADLSKFLGPGSTVVEKLEALVKAAGTGKAEGARWGQGGGARWS